MFTMSPEIVAVLVASFIQSLIVAYSYGRLRESVNSLHHRLDEHKDRIERIEDLHTHGSPQTVEI